MISPGPVESPENEDIDAEHDPIFVPGEENIHVTVDQTLTEMG